MSYTDAELTAIYNEANGIAEGKRPTITTARIFAAMRLVVEKERERCVDTIVTMDDGKLALDYAQAIRDLD